MTPGASISLGRLARLQEPRANVLVDGWRQGVAARLGSGAGPLLATVGPFAAVDLVTMTGASATLDEAAP